MEGCLSSLTFCCPLGGAHGGFPAISVLRVAPLQIACGLSDPREAIMSTHRPSTHAVRNLVALAAVLMVGTASAADITAPATPVATPVAPAKSPSVRQQNFVIQLAKADLEKQGVAEPTTEQLALAASNVQALRDKGMGWGAIANSLGLRLGAVVSAANRADKEERAEREMARKVKAYGDHDADAPRREVAGLAPDRTPNGGKGGGDGAGRSGNGAGSGASGGGGQSGGGQGAGNSGNGGSGKGGGNAGNGGGGKGGGNGGGNGGGKGGGNGGGRAK